MIFIIMDVSGAGKTVIDIPVVIVEKILREYRLK